MRSALEQRVRKLEEAHQPAEVPVALFTEEEREIRWLALRQRAAQGDPDARWRVERIKLFIEHARKRQDERLAATA